MNGLGYSNLTFFSALLETYQVLGTRRPAPLLDNPNSSFSRLAPGPIPTEWKLILTTAKNEQHPPLTHKPGDTISPKLTPFLEKLCLQ